LPEPGGIFVAQNGVCFLQQDEALDSHRKLSTYFEDVSFYQAPFHLLRRDHDLCLGDG
jgi:spermidine synthase